MLLRQAIHGAMVALGGQTSAPQVTAWINQHHPGRWRDVPTAMRDLVTPRPSSSSYGTHRGFLTRVSRGVYRI